jgi:hypothetical protein
MEVLTKTVADDRSCGCRIGPHEIAAYSYDRLTWSAIWAYVPGGPRRRQKLRRIRIPDTAHMR